MDFVIRILTESWLILGAMSPYLLFGFAVAGLLSVLISPAWVERNLGGSGFSPILKATLFGIPLPLCSCGILPVAASMRHHGSSKAATASFLLSTPQTGVDSIAITYGMLGPVFAIFRPLAALITGLIGGSLISLTGNEKNDSASIGEVCQDECCVPGKNRSIFRRIADYGLIRLPGDIGKALLVGILISGIMTASIPKDYLNLYIGSGILSILILMTVGVPIYVCATASVPIAAGFIHMGASEGAALAFLIAGPATNAAAFTTTWNILGRKPALLYLLTVAGSAIGFGLLLDRITPLFDTILPASGEHVHSASNGTWDVHFWAAIMLSVIIVSYIARRKKNMISTEKTISDKTSPMDSDRFEFQVTGMTCSHCADAVKRGLTELDSVTSASVNLGSGEVIVTGDKIDHEKLFTIVRNLGYGVRNEP